MNHSDLSLARRRPGHGRENWAAARTGAAQPQPPDRLPPHSEESEQMLIGSLMSGTASGGDSDTLEMISRVRDSFYDVRHKTIALAIYELAVAGSPVEVVSLAQKLRGMGELDGVGGIAYLSTLMEKSVGASSFNYYADIVTDLKTRRDIIRACTEAASSAYDCSNSSAVQVLSSAESAVCSIRDSVEGQAENTLSDANALARSAIDYAESLHTGTTNAIPTGFVDLDSIVHLEPGDLCVVGARPSAGKTSLACNIMVNVATREIPVGMLSLEMTSRAVALRMACSLGRVESGDLRRNTTEQNLSKFMSGVVSMSRIPLFVDYGFGITASHARSRISRMVKRHGVKMCVVDYLQLLKPSEKRDSREQEVASVVRELKSIAGQLQIPLIVLAQLNREVDRGETPRRPRLSDLRESGATEADADQVLLIHPEQSPEDINVVPTKIVVAKNRNGATGDVQLVFMKQFTKFESASVKCYTGEE